VLRRRDLPEEDGGRRFDLCGGKRGDEVPASLGGARLPFEARRGWRLGTAYAVGAKLVVLFGSDVLEFPVAELMLISCGWLRGVPLVCCNVT
jgi:hypothetical protein